LVILGNKKPLVVDFKSRMAETLVPPFGLISIDCADAAKDVKIDKDARNVLMIMFFF
jgi:hypothetical protein